MDILSNTHEMNFTTKHESRDKYLESICDHIISKYTPQFLVFYDRVYGVRY